MNTSLKNKFSLLTFRNKISLHFILIIFLLASISYFSINYLEEALKKNYYTNLTTINQIKRNQIEHYFNTHEKELATLASLPFVLKASQELTKTYNTDEYKEVYKKYHQLFRNYLQYHDFENTFLIDVKNDNIVFSYKNTLEDKNITSKMFDHSNFQQLYYSMMIDKGLFKLVDFDFFKPSNGEPAAFYATPIFDEDLNIVTILVLQISIEEINNIITGYKNWQKEGLGNTGETYLVASDCKIRTDSRFFIEDKTKYFDIIKKTNMDKNTIELMEKYDTNILFHPISKRKCEKLFSKRANGVMIEKDLRGVEVLLAYAPINIEGVNWYIVSEIDKDEAFELIDFLGKLTIITLLGLIVILSITTHLFTNAITKPINQIIDAFEELGRGNLTKRLKIDYSNEFSVLAISFNKALKNLKELSYSVEKLSIISSTDFLTKIYNRHKFLEELKDNITRIKRTNENLSIAMIDIDFFKKVNDRYGHNVGDEVLIKFANVIKKELRQSDVFARWGGEEFIVLFLNTDITQAEIVANKLRKSIEETDFKKIDKLTCSIGVSQYKKDDLEKEFIHRADEALYKAKHNGRNKVMSLQ